MSRIEELKKRRAHLLNELIKLDDEMRAIVPRVIHGKFVCTCGMDFTSYFRLDLHVSTLGSPDHRGIGDKVVYFKCDDCRKQYQTLQQFDAHKPSCKKIYGQVVNKVKTVNTKDKVRSRNVVINIDQL